MDNSSWATAQSLFHIRDAHTSVRNRRAACEYNTENLELDARALPCDVRTCDPTVGRPAAKTWTPQVDCRPGGANVCRIRNVLPSRHHASTATPPGHAIELHRPGPSPTKCPVPLVAFAQACRTSKLHAARTVTRVYNRQVQTSMQTRTRNT